MTHRIVLFLLMIALISPSAARAQDPFKNREVAEIANGLYRASDGERVTVFLVTSEGILLADPLNVGFATWLRDELGTRFPGAVVKYVVYGGFDLDRIAGGGIFTRTADLIARNGFNETLKRARVRTPGERWKFIPGAESEFDRRRVVTLGGRQIEILHLGDAPAPEAALLYFPDHHIVFAAGHPSSTAPFSERVRPSETLAWMQGLMSLPFETLMDGDGNRIPRAAVAAAAEYVSTLMRGVGTGHAHGLTAGQVQRGTSIAPFGGTPFAAIRDQDIAHVYPRTRLIAMDAYGAAFISSISAGGPLCETAYACPAGATTREIGGGGIGMSIRGLRVLVEMSGGQPLTSTLTSPDQNIASSRREVLLSTLAGFTAAPSSAFHLTVLGGFTFMKTDTASLLAPLFRQVFTIHESTVTPGLTAGADIAVPLGGHVDVILPIRATRFARRTEPGMPLTQTDIRGGAGIRIKLFQVLR
jgi:hypothetical protein